MTDYFRELKFREAKELGMTDEQAAEYVTDEVAAADYECWEQERSDAEIAEAMDLVAEGPLVVESDKAREP